MGSPSGEDTVFLDRASRMTRGKRMTKLLDEEIEEDEQFWNQDALLEEENDINYVEEAEVADEFDSDFEEDESEPEDDGENGADERVKPKKRLIFPGKHPPKRKSKKKDNVKLEAPEDAKAISSHKSEPSEQRETPEDLEGEKIVRKSTRTSVIVRQAERDAIRAAMQATMKHPVKKKKEGEEKRMTQEEMLLEAAQTEIMNLRNLERVLAREEEVKKKAIVPKAVYSGPQIRYISKDGKNCIEFSKGLAFNTEIDTSSVAYPEKSLCVITGLPAKYRDPKTGLPYATIDAFKIIRERFLKDESDKARQLKLDMGPLYDSLLDEGFPLKHRRSVKSRTSNSRSGARFRLIPALEHSASD